MGTGYDLLIYRDFTDTFDHNVKVGDSASVFGGTFRDLNVVALGPPLHEGKDRTIVLAYGGRPMSEIQKLLNNVREEV